MDIADVTEKTDALMRLDLRRRVDADQPRLIKRLLQ